MKLSDIEAVGELKKRRVYLQLLTDYAAEGRRPKVTIGGSRDLPPEVVDDVMPFVDEALRRHIEKAEADLRALGVVVD